MWSWSANVQPSPESAGVSLRNKLFIVSIADQPVHSDDTMLTAVILPSRSRSSSGAKPSPPITFTWFALAPRAGTTPSVVM